MEHRARFSYSEQWWRFWDFVEAYRTTVTSGRRIETTPSLLRPVVSTAQSSDPEGSITRLPSQIRFLYASPTEPQPATYAGGF